MNHNETPPNDEMKIKYITQKIDLYGQVYDVEELAKLYFESIGFHVYYSKDIFYHREEDWYNKVSHLELKGIPDLLLVKDQKISFVEVKKYNNQFGKSDSLRLDQLKWIESNPEFETTIFALEYTLNKEKSVTELEDKIEKQEEINHSLNLENEKLKREIEELRKSSQHCHWRL